ncbi:ROK family protein [Devosia sp. MC521]|uniref:ROK family protein n=1 Tax=Devosia sp. MC521 TaxID=2759954 RepID=UPI0015FAADE8|nr:ROK family protein [Devosia sp. MC521]MBJ6988090.1 ROK family protein [Devosia sp. MC521]QMW63378.1 ROK family protein [Devosia sp. MC521]
MITCFDIGGTTIKAAVAHSATDIVSLGRVATPAHDFDAFADAIAALIAQGGAPAGAAIAISIAGVVDPATNVATVANIPCINGRALGPDLSAKLSRPVIVGNDADCFALAEAHAGAGKGFNVVFGVILGTGVGGGIIADGRLIRGAGGFSGEWGHATIVQTETQAWPHKIAHMACGCGQLGCTDTIGGARGLERLHAQIHGQTLSSLDIVFAWGQGDTQSTRTMTLYTELLAAPLALLVNVLGPDIIPVGGGLGNSPELVAALDAAVRPRILRKLDRPLIVPAQLTVDAGLIGAASLAYSEGVV